MPEDADGISPMAEEADRISDLPDYLIYCIFKFMDMIEVVQTSVLSKRWRYVWLSNPYLTITHSYMWEIFEDKDEEKEYHGKDYYKEFEDFVDHVLFNRSNSNIQLFCLEYCHYPSNIQAWFSYLYHMNIQEVELNGVHVEEGILKSLCRKVKSLTLVGVEFMGDEDSGKLFLSCPVMESLVLENCKYCKWKGMHYQLDTYFDMTICAENLKLLKIEGCGFSNCYTLENVLALFTAVINVNVYYEEHLNNVGNNRLNNILWGLVNVQSLIYSAQTLQVCSEDSNTLKMVATFQKLRYLKLTRWKTSSSYISTVLKLLEKCPNVETLVLVGCSSQEPELREEDLGADLLSWCTQCLLKTIKIQVLTVFEIEFKFLKFLMENVMSLTDAFLTTHDMRSTEKEKLVNFCKKLEVVPKVRHLPRASGFQLHLGISSSSTTVKWDCA